MKTEILIDHEPVAAGRVVRLLLRLDAETPVRTGRLPLNLSLVIDRSGSMYGGKLAAATHAAAQLVRRLSPDDLVSVVAYDDQVQTVAEPAKGAAQAALPRQIEAIATGGSTNLSGGWLRGRELVAGNRLEAGVNRVILLTDGLANVGIVDSDRLTGLAAQAKKDGVTTTTIGFGADYNEHVLRAMADAGGGNMYYIEEEDQAAAIFADELQGLLDLGAQNVAVEIRPGNATQLVAVHHDYPSQRHEDSLRVELGDLYAREPKPLLAEFLVTGAITEDTAIAQLVVTGDVLTPNGGVEHHVLTLPVMLSPTEGAHVEPELRREMLLLAAARARRDALKRRDDGDFPGAAASLRAVGGTLREAAPFDADFAREADELDTLADSFVAMNVSAADAKYMYQRAYNETSGRRKKDELIRRMRRRKSEGPPTA